MAVSDVTSGLRWCIRCWNSLTHACFDTNNYSTASHDPQLKAACIISFGISTVLAQTQTWAKVSFTMLQSAVRVGQACTGCVPVLLVLHTWQLLCWCCLLITHFRLPRPQHDQYQRFVAMQPARALAVCLSTCGACCCSAAAAVQRKEERRVQQKNTTMPAACAAAAQLLIAWGRQGTPTLMRRQRLSAQP